MIIKTKTVISILVLLITIIIVAGFLFFKSKSKPPQFVSEAAFRGNQTQQVRMSLQTLEQLRKQHVTPEKELKLEYFFYTNSTEKAQQLAHEIEKLNYTVEYGNSDSEPDLFIITGWTTTMKMSDATIQRWVKEMCQLGYTFDCDFDGWGTNPNP